MPSQLCPPQSSQIQLTHLRLQLMNALPLTDNRETGGDAGEVSVPGSSLPEGISLYDHMDLSPSAPTCLQPVCPHGACAWSTGTWLSLHSDSYVTSTHPGSTATGIACRSCQHPEDHMHSSERVMRVASAPYCCLRKGNIPDSDTAYHRQHLPACAGPFSIGPAPGRQAPGIAVAWSDVP